MGRYDTLKLSFFISTIISIILHIAVMSSITLLYSPVRQVLDITPVEILRIHGKGAASLKGVKGGIPKSIPPAPKKKFKRKRIKKEPEKSPVVEERISQNVEQAMPPEPPPVVLEEGGTENVETIATETEGKETEVEDSEYEAEGGIGEGIYGVEGGTGEGIYGIEGGTGKEIENEIALFKTMALAKIGRSRFYPSLAREMGLEGNVGLRFVIQPDGKVSDIKVVSPSPHEILNRAACETIKNASPFYPMPKGMENTDIVMKIDIRFRLK